MKPPTLDDVVPIWNSIPPEERAARLAALKAGPKADEGPLVTRWAAGAKALSVTVRGFRNIAKAAGIRPVAFPGRRRAIGIRTADLRALVDGRSGFTLIELLAVVTIAAIMACLVARLLP